MSVDIHKTAIVSKNNVELGNNVVIGPFCIVKDDVKISDNTVLKSNVIIESYVDIGKNNTLFPHCVIGEIPQDLKFKNEVSYVQIGDNNVIRECVTINRGTENGGGVTRIGNSNMFMAYSHIAHDCQLESNIIIANAATAAGHVEIQEKAIIGGLSAIHQFVRVGKFSIIGGMTRVPKDVIPFSSIAGNGKCYGVNNIGLQRNNFSEEDKNIINKCFKILYRSGFNLKQALEKLDNEFHSENQIVNNLIKFIKTSKRGVILK